MIKNLIIASLLVFLVSCSRPQDFLYPSSGENGLAPITQSLRSQQTRNGTPIDVLWIVDNSPSMTPYQMRVRDNAEVFMREFTRTATVNWKMGLISTSTREEPYAGFTERTRLDAFSKNPLGVFKSGIDKLGDSGNNIEKMFEPVIYTFEHNSSFLRPGANLIFIVVTDTEEQSDLYDPVSFLQELSKYAAKSKAIITYGIFSHIEYGCKITDDPFHYPGSRYERLVQLTHGKTMNLCGDDFGKKLAEIGRDIVSRAGATNVRLKARPVIESIVVRYHDQSIPGGSANRGGKWLYDYETNSVIFHDLGFLDMSEPDSELQVTFVPIAAP